MTQTEAILNGLGRERSPVDLHVRHIQIGYMIDPYRETKLEDPTP